MLTPGLTGDALIRELNRQLTSVEDRLSRALLRDREGHVDLEGRRLRNVAHTKEANDVPSRKELYAKGMYETPSGVHRANSTIEAPNGIRSLVHAREDKELITLGQVKTMVGSAGNAVTTDDTIQIAQGTKVFRGLGLNPTSVALNAAATLFHNLSFAFGGLIGSFIRITGPTNNFTVTGLQRSNASLGGVAGQIAVLWNRTNVSMTLLHESGSTPANQFSLAGQVSATIRKRGSMMLIYDSFDSKWIPVSFA